jgi:hypothetical protein
MEARSAATHRKLGAELGHDVGIEEPAEHVSVP